ncbi:ATP-binding protein [Ramlibacter sp. XY19]|uniref:hybrid sensor histidine kinase/response regulator n=1 Tax=Ramlibacter paludis TaxID=2908000 RepID=UPI0023DB2668|nr:ATP-binding protein [Ramlibacter paludis]MCG2592739.1 ATP-binding protein [Ramlibacter paludis]
MNLAGPLRLRLFFLAACGLLPLALVAGVVLAYLNGERERDAQQAALAVSRALASALDAELRATASVLQSIALSDELQPQRLADFHALARRVADGQGWRSIVLADATGKVLQSSTRELDVASPQPVDPASMARAIATREPVVGRVAQGPNQRGPAFAVRVPVLREGKLVYVLSAVNPIERVLALVQRQRLPVTSVVGVFDQDYNRVARSLEHTSARPSPSLQKLLDTGAAEGSGPTRTLEGVPSQTGFVRLPWSGWVVATGIAPADAGRALYGMLGAVGGGLLASLALAAFFAWYFARGVIGPIDRLKAAAGALGRGKPVDLPPLEIAELQEVATALRAAALERHDAEAERERLLARATEALRLAEDAGRSKDEFLAMLGHELRNPLAPMATALHLMARKGDERTRLEREVMERQVGHMKRLVDDLLDVSRITSQRLEMRFTPLRLADVVRQAAAGLQPVLGARRFSVDIAPDAEQLWVSGDDVRLGQVLNNLLGNAIKFAGSHAQVGLRLRRVGDSAEVRVADDGPGMPPEVLARVFDLFYQAPQETDRSRGGLGLGLAIVRSLVEMHSGTVLAESAGAGRGSSFIVRLPLVAAPAQDLAPDAGAEAAGRRGRVLVVDDNQDAADTAATLLRLTGYEVQVAYDPQAALRVLAAFEPQVALLDIGLPGMNGYELAQHLREHPNGRGAVLVALTGYGTRADVQKAQEAGFARHLVKPAPPDVLLAVIDEHIPKT